MMLNKQAILRKQLSLMPVAQLTNPAYVFNGLRASSLGKRQEMKTGFWFLLVGSLTTGLAVIFIVGRSFPGFEVSA
jgi:hypothetical protein